MSKLKLYITYIVAVASMLMMASCDSEFQKDELNLQGKAEASIVELTGSNAKIRVKLSGILSQSIAINKDNLENLRLYYGTTANPLEMTKYSEAYVYNDGSLLGNGFGFTLPELQPATTYYIALKVDTIFTHAVTLKDPNPMNIKTSATTGFVVPEGVSSFTTLNSAFKAVDLGLSVLWAETDLGSDEDWYTPTYMWTNDIIQKLPPLMNIAGSEYDPVTKALGEGWRMPTADEYKELIENTSVTYRTDKEYGGFIVCRNLSNGKYITFYPQTGGLTDGWEGIRWTSNVCEVKNSLFYVTVFSFTADNVEMKKSLYSFTKKYPIRPVHVK